MAGFDVGAAFGQESSEDTTKLVLGVAELAYRALPLLRVLRTLPSMVTTRARWKQFRHCCFFPLMDNQLGQLFPVDSQPQPTVSVQPHGSQDGMGAPSTARSLDGPFDDMYRAASLPANVLATTAGQCLEAVVQEIQRGNYHKARWMWYTRILGYPNDGIYNMEGSTFRNFNEYLSGLFSVTRESIYSCSSPTCPNPVKTHRRRTTGWQLSTGSIINQAAINKSVEESIRPAEKTDGDICREWPVDDVSDSVIYKDQGAWKRIEMVDEEGRNTNFYAAEAWYLKYPVTSHVGQELEDQALSADKEFDELSGDEQVRSWSPPLLAPNKPAPFKITN
ncbi:hypothetical protein EC957_003690 [Mortierella hygrophila]|uniref:Uncharacterized protein n=1 Tax=Mortierella hygrophila TaxID=979708 RepID=A0A9P6F322_9FUNG|nr:hypothetical protein EC957_003690 [Mortierella hygrophila]